MEKYLPALEAVVGTDSHEGLGEVLFATEDGLGVLGQYIYYDSIVVHGPGDDDQ